MKTPKEFAGELLTSEAELKRMATTRKRLSGGLQAVVRQEVLSHEEHTTLVKAVAILDQLATARKKAAAIKKLEVQKRAKRQSEIRSAMAPWFATIETIAAKVAIIASQQSYMLKNDTDGVSKIGTRFLLTEIYADCLESIVSYAAIAPNLVDLKPSEVAQFVREKFETARPSLEAKFKHVVQAFESEMAGGSQ